MIQESRQYMAKKLVPSTPLEDIFYPIPKDTTLSLPASTELKERLGTQFIRQALKASYRVTEPTAFDLKYHGPAKALVTNEQIELVTNLLGSLEPRDSIETALAVQFTVTYIHGMKAIQVYGDEKKALALLAFGHQALDMLQKYRNRGAQQINVQYNVNQGQIVNVKNEGASSTQS